MSNKPKVHKVRLPSLYPKQEAALFNPARFGVVEGSTKSGKTAGCITWQAAQVLSSYKGSNHWWVAPVYSQAKIAFRRVSDDLAELITHRDNKDLKITFGNGAAWWFKSGDNPDSLFGEEIESGVVDEASRCKEKVWEAIRSTTSTTQAPIRGIANVKGRGNWFYKLCRKAESGAPGYHYAKLTAQDAVDGGILRSSELEQAAVDLPHEVYRELYFCEPSDNAYNPFGMDKLASAQQHRRPGEVVVWGLDLARKRDWTVLIGLDQHGYVADMYRTQAPWTQQLKVIVEKVGRTPVLVDATGVGDPVMAVLEERKVNVTGYVFTGPSKQHLMERLQMGIQEGELGWSPDRLVLINELEEFEYSYSVNGRVSYAAPAGLHDDCVMSLALAYQHGKELKKLRRGVAAARPVITITRSRNLRV